MSLAAIASTNLSYEDHVKNLIITNETATGNILFTSDHHNISPKITGTLIAEEAEASTDAIPRIRLYQVDEDGNEVKTILRKKAIHFLFCFEDGSQAPQRITTADNRTDMVAEALSYLNTVMNATQAVSSPTLTFSSADTIDARRDATNTTVLFDNGKSFAVNSIRAIENSSGLIDVVDHESVSILFQNINHENVTISDADPGSNIQTVINQLNALFTVQPVGGSSIPTGLIPINNGVDVTDNLAEGATPVTGDPLNLYTVNGDTSGHGARMWSTETINVSEEHFTVKITGRGRFILGLGDATTDSNDSGTADDIEEMQSNSGTAHSGIWYSQAFYNYGSYIAPWTTYGSNSGLVYGPGWTPNNTNINMRYNTDVQDSFSDYTPVLFKVGITTSGHVGVWYFDENRSNDWILCSRSATALPSRDWFLVVKLWDGSATLVETPQVHERAVVNVTGTDATTYNLLGLASQGVPATVVTVSSANSSDYNEGFYTSEALTEPGDYFEITGHTGDVVFGLANTNEYDVATLDDVPQVDYDRGYFFAHMVEDEGNINSNFFFRDDLLSGSGMSSVFNSGNNTDAHNRIRIGFDVSGRATIWTADHATNDSWVVVRRHNLVAPDGNYVLLIKSGQSEGFSIDTDNVTKGTLSTAPTLNFRYIESPDGVFYYPLFATAEEANYYDQHHDGTVGTGTSSANVFVDEPTNTTWYLPTTGSTSTGTSAPSGTYNGAPIVYTEIATNEDSLYAPADLTLSDQTFSENQVVNIQLTPQDMLVTVTGLPPGLSFGAGFVTGTTEYVPVDTEYTVSVSRSNAYGTNSQTITYTIQDNASLGDLTGYTETAGNLLQPNRMILTHDALVQYDTVLSQGQQITYSYTSGATPPTIGILSTTGETNLAAFDSATDTFGSGDYDFSQTSQWDLRYATGNQNIGGSVNVNEPWFDLTGWSSNTSIVGESGSNLGAEFKLEYANDGYIRLYRDGVLQLTSASTFAGDQTITLAAFDEQAHTDVYIPANWSLTNIGAGTTTPPTGFTDPVESGEMASTTLFGNGGDGAVTLTETLKVNHRYIVPRAWIEANVLPHITGSDENKKFFFGVPKDSVNWTSVDLQQDWHAVFRLEGFANSHTSRIYTMGTSGTTDNSVSVNSTTSAFYDYAIEWDGSDLHVIACNINDINTQPAVNNGGSFSRVGTLTDFASDHSKENQELTLVIGVKADASAVLTTSGLQQIRIPWSANVILVGESSSGNGQFGQVQSSYFDLGGQHAPSAIGFAHPTINAGYTYTYIYHPSMESGDYIEFRLASDSTTVYTTGITTFDNTTDGDPSYSGTQGYKGLTFVVPSDAPPLRAYHYNTYQSGYFDAGRDVPISGSTYVTPVTGVTIEGPSGNFTGNVINSGSSGWISLNETLAAGERLVLDSAFITDLVAAIPDNSMVFFGLKGDSWTNASYPMGSYKGTAGLRFYRSTAAGVYMLGYANNGASSSLYSLSTSNAQAFIEISNSGDNIRVGYAASTSYNASSTAHADWDNNLKMSTGNQSYGITSLDVGIYWNSISGNTVGFDISDVDWTGLSEIAVPTAAAPLTTPWTKALDFSGSAERGQQVTNSSYYTPLMMGGVGTTVSGNSTPGYTSNDSNARPWATAVVFNADGHNSNQHIWNLGEGAASTDDNIYLRLSSTRQLFFGWGRDGSRNELYIGTITAGRWYGIYVGHTGERLSGNNANSSNLSGAFDVKLMSSADNFVSISDQGSTAEWGNTGYSTIGGRMDRQLSGAMTVGGRGSNRSFHGKVASMVITTLKRNVPMPDETEIKMMIRDPQQWMTDYKVGQSYRGPATGSNYSGWQKNSSTPAYSTQVWLMGDGAQDGYAQIRNNVYPAIQNIYPMNMISMVSNDIQTVNIPGLT